LAFSVTSEPVLFSCYGASALKLFQEIFWQEEGREKEDAAGTELAQRSATRPAKILAQSSPSACATQTKTRRAGKAETITS